VHHSTWYGNRQLNLEFCRTKTDFYEIKNHIRELRLKCRGASKIYEANIRQEWHHTNVYTSDAHLLEDLMQDELMMKHLVELSYTSEEYEKEMGKLEGIPTDVKLVRKKVPGQEYRIYLSSTIGRPQIWENMKNLKPVIENHAKNVQINNYLLDRLSTGNLYTSDHNFYCDDPDVIMMMYLSAPGAIRKVYKIVERD
jgi:hypothetical protein